MTYRTSSSTDAGFFSRQRSLAGRRLWPIVLTFLAYLIYHVLGTVTALHAVIEDTQYSHYTAAAAAERAEMLYRTVSAILGERSISWFLLALPFGAILAMEGFSWMDDRRQVDFYESLPVPRRQRFTDICIGSVLYFVFSYLITMEIGLAAAGAMGALSRALVVEALWTAAKTIAFFLAVYGLGVLSVMLTGSVLIAWLAFLVLLLYEPIFKAVLGGYCSEFLATWAGNPGGIFFDTVLSPFSMYGNDSPLKAVLHLLWLAALHFALAGLCYRLRKNECAGTAVVFGPVRSVVRVAMAVIVGLVVGLFCFTLDTGRGLAIPLLWMVLFTVIAACIMQIIYEYDFRALFRRPLEIVLSVFLTLLVCLGLYLDLGGYDRYAPDPDEVEDAALSLNMSDMTIDEEGHTIDSSEFGSLYMHLDNVEDVIAIARYGQEYTRQAMIQEKAEEESASGENAVQVYDFTVEYRLKNRKTVRRRFSVPSTADPAMMDAVIGTENFREGSFFVYHDDAIRKRVDDFTIEYTNGLDWKDGKLTGASYEAFREAYILDLEQFSYHFARASRPVGQLCLSRDPYYDASLDDDFDYVSLTCPVYPSFTHTAAYLQENGLWLESLDYENLPSRDDENISREDLELLDSLDESVFSGPLGR